MLIKFDFVHHILLFCTVMNLKHSDKQIWENLVDPDQTVLLEKSDQGLRCLQFSLHLFWR